MKKKLSPSLPQIRHFLAIADCGSLRAAAEQLGISQPALSKSLRSLEQTLGSTLVSRDARGSSLTVAGEIFVARARLIENEVLRATHEIQALSGAHAAHLRIGVSAIPSILIVPQAVAKFTREHPNIGLELVGGMPSVLLPRLVDGSLDFLVGPNPTVSAPDLIDSYLLMQLRVNIIVRKGHPLEHAQSLRDFANAQWVVSSNSSYAQEKIQTLLHERQANGQVPYIRVDSLFAVLSFIKKTDFIGIVPSIEPPAALYGNDVSVLNIKEMDMFEEYRLFYRKNHVHSRYSAHLIEGMQKAATQYALEALKLNSRKQA